jgi:hypothetical protein
VVTSERVVVMEEPFRVAVMLADWSESSEPVAAKKVAEVALAATIAAEGTVNKNGALLESVTQLLLGVALERLRVQAVLELEATVEGAH